MSSASIDTVSVLMTDLVGSTATADRLGPAAAEELRAEHFGLLRGALERTAGREVKNLGDGLMVVFSSASESLTCAVEMQQAIEDFAPPTENDTQGYLAYILTGLGCTGSTLLADVMDVPGIGAYADEPT